jgi:hypothetical protein
MNNIKLPPEIDFHEDFRLLIYRRKRVIHEAEFNRVLSVIEALEAIPQQPFNRFSDTSETHEVELNFRYIIQVSLHRRLLTDKATGDARPEESRNLKVKTSKKSPRAK